MGRFILLFMFALTLALSGHSAVAADDATALLEDTKSAMKEVDSFHFVLSTPQGETKVAETFTLDKLEGDVQRPSGLRATVSVKAGPLGLEIRVIALDGKIWVTNPMSKSESWVDLTKAGNDIPLPEILNPDMLINIAVSAMQDPVIDGTEMLNGVETTIVSGSVNGDQLVGLATGGTPVAGADSLPASVSVRVWIDPDNHPVRIEVSGALTPAEREIGRITRQIDLSQFDAIEPITAPATGA